MITKFKIFEEAEPKFEDFVEPRPLYKIGDKVYNKKINEFTDYRNVTGFGSMGQSGDQNTGPSFNKGPDAATFYRPDVITMQQMTMDDPYFNEKRDKMRKIKKNRYIPKLRRKKARYLRDVDKKSLKKL